MSTPRAGEPLSEAVEAGYERCLSCNACRSVCTVQVATGRLRPLEILRLAALGLADAALGANELWYCLQCNRCRQACPMSVEPSGLIRRLRAEAVEQGRMSEEDLRKLDELATRFQRTRFHMIARGAQGPQLEQMADEWLAWSDVPVESAQEALVLGATGTPQDTAIPQDALGVEGDLSGCMTCGACTTVCPVAQDRSVYDPVWIFRMVNLRRTDEVMRSPSLWLCLGCRACTEACTQSVAGHLVVERLQAESRARGLAPPDIQARLWAIDHALLPRYLKGVEELIASGVR